MFRSKRNTQSLMGRREKGSVKSVSLCSLSVWCCSWPWCWSHGTNLQSVAGPAVGSTGQVLTGEKREDISVNTWPRCHICLSYVITDCMSTHRQLVLTAPSENIVTCVLSVVLQFKGEVRHFLMPLVAINGIGKLLANRPRKHFCTTSSIISQWVFFY